MNFKGKAILLFAPSFFGYEKSIQKRLIELGANVDFFDERPANTFWTKAFIRLYPKLSYIYTMRYYRIIYDKIQDKHYDFIFVVNIEAMPPAFLEKVKKDFSSARFILYMWHSIFNKKNTIHYLPYFNDIFSFDKTDCKKIPQIKFRPLFYINEYETLARSVDFKYDLAFVGTAHSDRFALIQKVYKLIQSQGLKCYFYLYLQNWKLFFWHKFKNPAFRKAHLKDFHYKALAKNELFEVIKKSRTILDIQHPKQSGLTIRTIEMIGARRKLITTNSNIKEYDFYHPANIFIVDRECPVIPDDFFKMDYHQVNSDIYYKYSLDGWLDEIFTTLL